MPGVVKRNVVLGLDLNNRISELKPIIQNGAECANTVFVDGILSASIVSLKANNFNWDVFSDKDSYLYYNLSESPISYPLIPSGKILIIDVNSENPISLCELLRSNFMYLENLDIFDIINACTYWPAKLLQMDNVLEENRAIQPLLWQSCDLVNKRITKELMLRIL